MTFIRIIIHSLGLSYDFDFLMADTTWSRSSFRLIVLYLFAHSSKVS